MATCTHPVYHHHHHHHHHLQIYTAPTTVQQNERRRSQHSQDCKHACQQCFCDLDLWPFDPKINGFPGLMVWNSSMSRMVILAASVFEISYIHIYIHKSFLYSAYKFNKVTMRFGRQTSKFSEIVWKCQMTVPAVVVLLEGRSTGADRRLRSFYHPVCCVCAVRADSAIHWNPTAAGDGRHTTAGSSHQRGTQGHSSKWLVDESWDLEHDPLSDWQPVQLLKHRCDVVATTSAWNQARSSCSTSSFVQRLRRSDTFFGSSSTPSVHVCWRQPSVRQYASQQRHRCRCPPHRVHCRHQRLDEGQPIDRVWTLNPTKTQIMWLGTNQQLDKITVRDSDNIFHIS